MSKYTTELRFICENAAGVTSSEGYSQIDNIITKAVPKIFDFDFPIFDPAYKTPLCKKILKWYYTREICEETVGLWKLRLANKLNLIMPYYNQLYESQLLDIKPFIDTDVTTTHTGSEKSNTSTNTSSKSNSQTDATSTQSQTTSDSSTNYQLYSDTPQGGLQNVINEAYLTNATKTTNSNSGNTNINATASSTNNQSSSNDSTGNLNSTDEYLNHVLGKTGGMSYSKMLEEYRNTFINIDQMIIEELEPLFFMLW